MTSVLDKGLDSPSALLPRPVERVNSIVRLRDGGTERSGFIPLDRNERLSPLPERFIRSVRDRLDSGILAGYPVADQFYGQLARHTGMSRDRLQLTSGSDAAVKALFQVYSRAGFSAVMLSPSYAMYPIYSRMFGVLAEQIEFEADLTFSHVSLLDAIRPGVALVLLANPNQPTGSMIEKGELAEIIERAGKVGALVVVDEAYYPFSKQTVLPWIEKYRNLVVLRTFSKAWGLAGLRLGFAAGDPEVIANLVKVRSAYDVNAMAILCGQIALEHPEIALDYVRLVAQARDFVGQRLRELELEAPHCNTNFQLIRLGDRAEPQAVVDGLYNRGLLVKGPFAARCLSDCIRITLGPLDLMDKFINALEDTLRDVS